MMQCGGFSVGGEMRDISKHDVFLSSSWTVDRLPVASCSVAVGTVEKKRK